MNNVPAAAGAATTTKAFFTYCRGRIARTLSASSPLVVSGGRPSVRWAVVVAPPNRVETSEVPAVVVIVR